MKAIHIVEIEYSIDIDKHYSYAKFLSKLEYLKIREHEMERERKKSKRKSKRR